MHHFLRRVLRAGLFLSFWNVRALIVDIPCTAFLPVTSQILPPLRGQWLRYHPGSASFLTIQPTIVCTLSKIQLGFLLNAVIALGLSIL